jgi:hypothetical protein
MSTVAVSALRQRMVEDMTARQRGPHSQRSHMYSCKRFAAFLQRSPDSHHREHPPLPAVPRRDGDKHLQPQSHYDRAAVFVPRDAATAGPWPRSQARPQAVGNGQQPAGLIRTDHLRNLLRFAQVIGSVETAQRQTRKPMNCSLWRIQKLPPNGSRSEC